MEAEFELDQVQNSVQQDLMKIEIFFISTTSMVIQEIPVYNGLMGLFTELGGALSVWIGFSFIMFMEVIEYIIDATSFMVTKKLD